MANAIMLGLQRALAPARRKGLQPADNRGGWWPVIRESYAGAWQQNITITLEDGLRYWAVFRAIQIIASDVAKCRVKLVEQNKQTKLWKEVDDPDFAAVLRKPNGFQTRIQFYTNWLESKLSRGNTYVLKIRDASGRVVRMIVLDPNKVTPLVSDDGQVFYRLNRDNVAGLLFDIPSIPASEIIHDRWNTLYHPLVGLSPLYAAGINALTALKIETSMARLFQNGALPSGVLSTKDRIDDTTAARIKAFWDENYTGENAGKVAVLGDGLEYTQTTMSAVDAQLIEQLKWNDTTIFGVYGIPAFMGNVGTAPSYNNVEALNLQYYTQGLQIHFESVELLLDEGLGLTEQSGRILGTEFDLDTLVRMDTASKVKMAVEGLKGLWSSDEARGRWFDMPPTPGGNAVLSQQQNFSLEALAKRDAKDDPFKSAAPAPASPANDEPAQDGADATDKMMDAFTLRLAA